MAGGVRAFLLPGERRPASLATPPPARAAAPESGLWRARGDGATAAEWEDGRSVGRPGVNRSPQLGRAPRGTPEALRFA